jgi:hypothetical protein
VPVNLTAGAGVAIIDGMKGTQVPMLTTPIPIRARCRKCGYRLRGLPEPQGESPFRCPECGTPFDPYSRMTMSIGKGQGWPRLVAVSFKRFVRGRPDLKRLPDLDKLTVWTVSVVTMAAIIWGLTPYPRASLMVWVALCCLLLGVLLGVWWYWYRPVNQYYERLARRSREGGRKSRLVWRSRRPPDRPPG